MIFICKNAVSISELGLLCTVPFEATGSITSPSQISDAGLPLAVYNVAGTHL